jgi:hypothetical protein
MVLHTCYIEGTPRHVQSDTLEMLVQALEQLSPPTKERGGASNSKRKISRSKDAGQAIVSIVGKQLQRVIIRWVWLSAEGMSGVSVMW